MGIRNGWFAAIDQETRVLDNITGEMRLFSHDKKRIVLLTWNNRQSAL
jgi:hypothetical protein